jgi:coenzyme F420-reducing hydrogenase gamma subunit
MAKKTQKKKIVGIFSFSCDEGCSIFLTEIFNNKLLEWLEKMELVYFLALKDHSERDHYDIAVVEGDIANERDKKRLEDIRSKSDILIAMGTCTITGYPTAQRNEFNESQKAQIKEIVEKFNFLPKTLTVPEVVKVDGEVMGCPIDEKKFIETFEKFLNA